MIVYLVGFMGSGKSYTGKRLASELNVPHIDLDHWIEEKYGCTVSSIFANEGEEAFRQKETQALVELNNVFAVAENEKTKGRSVHLIVSTGGGTACFNNNMDWMNQNGLTIWLNPPLETLLRRLDKEKDHRPLISGLSKEKMKKFVEQKLEERSSFYNKAMLKLDDENVDYITLVNHLKYA